MKKTLIALLCLTVIWEATIMGFAFNPQDGFRDTTVFQQFPTDPRDDIQTLLDQIKAYLNKNAVYVADSGTADALAVTLDPAPSAYSTDMFLIVKKGASANTGAATINVNSLGVKSIKKDVSVALGSADMPASGILFLQYDGTNFQLLNPAKSNAVDTLDTTVTTHLAEDASLIESGHVQLQTTVDTTETKALTPKALNDYAASNTVSLASKADISYVDTQIAVVASGTPKGVYATLVALQTAFPTGDTGIYVVAADGHWYYWDTAAWADGGAYQATEIADDTIKKEKVYQNAPTANLFDINEATDGYYVNWNNGNLAASGIYCATGYIPVTGSEDYTLSKCDHYAWYDSSKVFVSGAAPGSAVPVTLTAPANAAYIRISIALTNKATYMIVHDSSVPSEYVPYGAVIPWLRVETDNLDPDFIANTPNTENWYKELTLPPTIYAVVGKEMNIYFDNLISDKIEDYNVDVIYYNTAKQQTERFTITPAAAGNQNIEIYFYDRFLNLVNHATAALPIAAADAKSGENPKCLFIGDSTTSAGLYTAELLNLFDADVMDVTLIGTQGSILNLHEGYSGRTVDWFYTDAASPFVYSGSFDFSQYMTDNSFAGVDFVFIHLGINDVFGQTTDTGVDNIITANMAQLEAMITNIKAYNASVKIGIMATIPPAASQDAFGKDYGTGQTQWRYKRNIHRYVKGLLENFKSRTAESIYIIPVNVNLDTVHNMGTETVAANSRSLTMITRLSSGVHPAGEGYDQIADTIYYALKNI